MVKQHLRLLRCQDKKTTNIYIFAEPMILNTLFVFLRKVEITFPTNPTVYVN